MGILVLDYDFYIRFTLQDIVLLIYYLEMKITQ